LVNFLFIHFFFCSPICIPIFEGKDLLKLRQPEIVSVNEEYDFLDFKCRQHQSRGGTVEETALVKENDFINLEKAQRALFICK
jgi:hypothetical protein